MCERACACASEWGKSECVGVWSRRRHAYAHARARARARTHIHTPPHTQEDRRGVVCPPIHPSVRATPAWPYPPLCLSRHIVSEFRVCGARACVHGAYARTLSYARTVRAPNAGRWALVHGVAEPRRPAAAQGCPAVPRPSLSSRRTRPQAERAAPSVRRATRRSVRDSARRSQIKRGVVKRSRHGRFGVPEQARDGLRSGDGDL